MIDAASLLKNLTARGIRQTPDPPKLIAEPSNLLTQDDCELIRAHKIQLLALLLAPDQALCFLEHLRGYTLPQGRMPAVSAMVKRLRPLLAAPELDPVATLGAIKATLDELTALGGHYDPELAAALGLVDGAFPAPGSSRSESYCIDLVKRYRTYALRLHRLSLVACPSVGSLSRPRPKRQK